MQVCDCDNCTAQLTKPTNQKLQLWYGKGATGKSTLLRHLIQTVGEENVLYTNIDDPIYGLRNHNRGFYRPMYSNKIEYHKEPIVAITNVHKDEVIDVIKLYIEQGAWGERDLSKYYRDLFPKYNIKPLETRYKWLFKKYKMKPIENITGKKYIVETNALPPNIADFADFVDLVHFTHVFV